MVFAVIFRNGFFNDSVVFMGNYNRDIMLERLGNPHIGLFNRIEVVYVGY